LEEEAVMRASSLRLGALLSVGILVAACSAGATSTPIGTPTGTATAAVTGTSVATVAPSPSPSPDACAAANLATLTPGKLTIGTDNPAFPPWFGGDPPAGSTWQVSDPLSGQGYESATAYAIAAKLGFSGSQVVWVVAAFDSVIQPGPKAFDFDINEVSYSADRAQAVDLSDGYFDNSQAVVATKGAAITSAKSVADLKAFKLGAQVGTTSYAYITDNIQPTTAAKVYNDSNGPIAALKARQIDGIVVDLGTAFEITGDGEVPNGVIVGSLPAVGTPEHFSVLLNKGSALTACVNRAIDALQTDGTLASLRQDWIATQGDAPALTP
jgi:polar amino acid transport system substrate-binding protein